MKIELDQSAPQLRITAYTDSSISIAGATYTNNIIIGNNQIIENSLPPTIKQLAPHHLDIVMTMQAEIVLFGTGLTLNHPADNISQTLFEHNIGMEMMDTGAACRSFNLLSGEARNIVCLMFIATSSANNR